VLKVVITINVLLVSIDAKNIHKPLAVWCIKSYCENYSPMREIKVLENNINDNIDEIIGKVYRGAPDIVGFSCYIWNIELICKIAKTLKKLLPECIIVFGGPEVTFENNINDYPFADYIIQGPGEAAFYDLLNKIEDGIEPLGKIISGTGAAFESLPSPYTEKYFDSFKSGKMISLKNQLIYYESSRGCPFHCEYCLSSVTSGVEYLPVKRVKDDLYKIIAQGAKCIKFIDRTFNADKNRANEILLFIQSLDTECTFHFEVAADLFNDNLLAVIASMPVCRVQFETGIQSVNEKTLDAVSRRTNTKKALDNIRRLTEMKNCHIHVDLIAGLPYDSLLTFSQAVNLCLDANPHMLQIGFLKILKGSLIRKKSNSYGCSFADNPPYEVLNSNCMSYNDILVLKGLAKVIDKFYNSGMYKNTVHFAVENIFKSAYEFFIRLADFCEYKDNYKSSLKNSYTILLNFLLQYCDRKYAEHYIKLDCLTFDAKGILPDGIQQFRDKTAEAKLKRKKEFGKCSIRVEYFEMDNKKRLFIYDCKDPVSKEFKVVELYEKID